MEAAVILSVLFVLAIWNVFFNSNLDESRCDCPPPYADNDTPYPGDRHPLPEIPAWHHTGLFAYQKFMMGFMYRKGLMQGLTLSVIVLLVLTLALLLLPAPGEPSLLEPIFAVW